MALPTLCAHAPSRARVLERQMARQREQEARLRQQWELHSQYFKQQNVHGRKLAAWSSRQSHQQSMSAYHREREKEARRLRLEERRRRLTAMLEEERAGQEEELRGLQPDRSSLLAQLVQKTDALRSAREDRRRKLAQELLKETWRKNNPELRKVESELHKDHVISHWQEQLCEKKEREQEEQEEKRRYENQYEETRRLALERIKQEEQRRKEEEHTRAAELRQQMEELKSREAEASRLQQEQDALRAQQGALEMLEEDRRRAEEKRKKSEMGRFLVRQYRAQLKRRAQQVQEELEADRKILAVLLEGEQEDKKLESARRERAAADVAWMKRVIEEQIQLEREREAQFTLLYREEAQNVWEKREAEWEKERRARERLMREVLEGRRQQLEVKMRGNREEQEASLRRREELLQELEAERETRRQGREHQERQRTARVQELDAQVKERHRSQLEEERRRGEEEEEEREALRVQDEELRQETERMSRLGFQEKPLSAVEEEDDVILDVVLLGCDGDELLGSLGDVIRTLDDLLGDQLHVLPQGPPAVGGPGLATLPLQTVGAGGQQAQWTPHRLRAWLLNSRKDTKTNRRRCMLESAGERRETVPGRQGQRPEYQEAGSGERRLIACCCREGGALSAQGTRVLKQPRLCLRRRAPSRSDGLFSRRRRHGHRKIQHNTRVTGESDG
ncbi:Trichoplein keratin filament-binding protein [Merluccius polli]|uniref:Trichoplein keratin filament-binding protein n=1 Tax=Merluccius polli TaxID=89951 RepID=A0AA47NV21_MERPO|nr:Trichoplein keratin filament-binding protein [Merluccius polli]